MKRMKNMLALALASTILLYSCSSDDGFNPGTAPEIPPTATMEMEVDAFTSGPDGSSARVMGDAHWRGAALQVGFWSTILAINLAIPIASFKAAIGQTPSFDRDRGLWVWNYDHTFVGRTYSSELTGQVLEGQITWNMYISEENGFQEVLWYTGVSEIDGTGGYWILNKNAENPTEYLRVDWSRENEEVGSIRYTLIEAGSDENGSYIEYGRTSGGDYNTFYTVELLGADKKAAIQWNSETGVGRVEYDDNGEIFCWDSSFQDVPCQ